MIEVPNTFISALIKYAICFDSGLKLSDESNKKASYDIAFELEHIINIESNKRIIYLLKDMSINDQLTEKGKKKLADLEVEWGFGKAEQVFKETHEVGDGTIKDE